MTRRFSIGSPMGGKTSEAARLKRLEIEKGGKLPLSSTDRYKRIMKKKLEENMQQSQGKGMAFQLPGAAPVERKMSRKTEEAMRMIAKRKAMKEEKELRKMVAIQPRTIPDAGRISKDGKIYDLGNNIAMKIDGKTGKITTASGMYVGKYNTRKMMRTNMLIRDKLQTVSPYAIQQKKLQMMQQWEEQKRLMEQGVNAWGTGGSASEQFMQKHYGQSGGGVYGEPGQQMHNRGSNVGAWGAMSSNVLGTYAENAWGGMADNVWGGTDSNIWGGIGGDAWSVGGFGGSRSAWGSGGGSIFGSSLVNWNKRGLKIFGTGKPGQKNFLKPLGALFAGVPLLNRAFRARMRSK